MHSPSERKYEEKTRLLQIEISAEHEVFFPFLASTFSRAIDCSLQSIHFLLRFKDITMSSILIYLLITVSSGVSKWIGGTIFSDYSMNSFLRSASNSIISRDLKDWSEHFLVQVSSTHDCQSSYYLFQ